MDAFTFFIVCNTFCNCSKSMLAKCFVINPYLLLRLMPDKRDLLIWLDEKYKKVLLCTMDLVPKKCVGRVNRETKVFLLIKLFPYVNGIHQ